jgi:predicted nucleotide-binding protein
MARRSTAPAPFPQRASLVRPRSEVDQLLARRIQSGHDIQKEFVGSMLHLLPSTKWRSDYKKAGDAWREYNLEVLRVIFSNDQQAKDYDSPAYSLLGGDIERDDRLLRLFEQDMDSQIAALESIRERLDLYPESLPGSRVTAEAAPTTRADRSKVFVVHGHDQAARMAVASFLQKIGLEAITLQEQPDQSRTIIEKFEASAREVGFAVVLLTPDDVGGAVSASSPMSRARQNVIFELGYFVGKLGREKVCLLRKGDIEGFSDFDGVVYTPMDTGDGWKLKLAKELRAAKFEFDDAKVWA